MERYILTNKHSDGNRMYLTALSYGPKWVDTIDRAARFDDLAEALEARGVWARFGSANDLTGSLAIIAERPGPNGTTIREDLS